MYSEVFVGHGFSRAEKHEKSRVALLAAASSDCHSERSEESLLDS